MTGDELKEAGERLFGKKWRMTLARKLDLDPITLWRYLQRDKIPTPVALAVQALLKEKA